MCAKANIGQVLQVYGSIGEQVLKDAVDKISATHKTVQSIRSEVTETDTTDRLQLLAREWFSLIEKGRKPTNKNPSPAMINFLTDYARARGMNNPESAAWAIAKTINKQGDETHRRGGRDVYSKELDKFVDEVKNEISKTFVGFYINEIKRAFK